MPKNAVREKILPFDYFCAYFPEKIPKISTFGTILKVGRAAF